MGYFRLTAIICAQILYACIAHRCRCTRSKLFQAFPANLWSPFGKSCIQQLRRILVQLRVHGRFWNTVVLRCASGRANQETSLTAGLHYLQNRCWYGVNRFAKWRLCSFALACDDRFVSFFAEAVFTQVVTNCITFANNAKGTPLAQVGLLG